MTPRVYNILQNLNLRIPEDVSLVGFDEAGLCGQLAPGLTVFNQNIPSLVKQVLDFLRSPDREVEHGAVPPLLLERCSVSSKENPSSPDETVCPTD